MLDRLQCFHNNPCNDTIAGIMTDGDSITAGAGVTGISNYYPSQAMAGLNSYNALSNVATAGLKCGDLQTRLAGTVQPQISAWSALGIPVVYTLMCGTNDGANPTGVYATMQAMCSTVQGYGATQIVFLTLLPAAGKGGTFEAFRQSLNTLIRAGGSCATTVSDPGNDATIGQAGQSSNLTYYQSDQIHPTAAGDTIIGVNYLRPTLQSLGIR